MFHRFGKMRRKLPLILAFLLIMLTSTLFIPQSHAAILSGWGTPTINGIVNPSEWANAGNVVYSKGPATGTFYMMNDATNLYIGIIIDGDDDFGPNDGIRLYFDNDNGGEASLEDGDDLLIARGASAFADNYYDFGLGTIQSDMFDGGSIDGQAAGSRVGSANHFELSHPLNTLDNAHDFSLSTGQLVGFHFQPFVDGTYYAGIGETPNDPSSWPDDYQVARSPGPISIPSSVVGGITLPSNNLSILAPYIAMVTLAVAILAFRKRS
jgi:hypothetical protein